MPRTKKSVVKKNKSVNVIVQVNSHNKRKTAAPKAKTPNHPTIFVNPASNNGFHENALTQKLLHHLILNNKELPKIDHPTTDLHKKPEEVKAFAPTPSVSTIVKDETPLLEPTPMPRMPDLPLTDEVKPTIVARTPLRPEAPEFTPIRHPPTIPSRSPSPPHTEFPSNVAGRKTYFFDKYGLRGISHFTSAELERLHDVEKRNGDFRLEADLIKRERRERSR